MTNSSSAPICKRSSNKINLLQSVLKDLNSSILVSDEVLQSHDRSSKELTLLSTLDYIEFPSLNLFQNLTKSTDSGHKTALLNLRQSICHDFSNISSTPRRICLNLLNSFGLIIEANLFQFFKRILSTDSTKQFSKSKAEKLSSLFFSNDIKRDLKNLPIEIESTTTCFSLHCDTTFSNTYDKEVMTFDLNMISIVFVNGKRTRVTVSTDGAIQGRFRDSDDLKLSSVNLELNAPRLLTSLRMEARKLIILALNTASSKVDVLDYRTTPKLSNEITAKALAAVSVKESKRKIFEDSGQQLKRQKVIHNENNTMDQSTMALRTLLFVASKLRKEI